ncbi:hypothetical protein J21TS7_31200 [Paenibacillus cineris]|uniref:Uncharacterized protein n=1 Tax=Paenibacillus cineris TaxID=237530 RepID=A0ABQ4LE24_9BACL|nr:hypothetical protein J21TS7_31200 [Paenibacillus cineris]
MDTADDPAKIPKYPSTKLGASAAITGKTKASTKVKAVVAVQKRPNRRKPANPVHPAAWTCLV